MSNDFFLDPDMMDLFRQEVDTQAAVLNGNLLSVENASGHADQQLAACMRAAHSVKGAARIVGVDVAVGVAHVMEDCLVMAQEGVLRLNSGHIDRLLQGVDLLVKISASNLADESILQSLGKQSEAYVSLMGSPISDEASPATIASDPSSDHIGNASAPQTSGYSEALGDSAPRPDDHIDVEVIDSPKNATDRPVSSDSSPTNGEEVSTRQAEMRVGAYQLNRMTRLSAELMVQSLWVKRFEQMLSQVKRHQQVALSLLEKAHGLQNVDDDGSIDTARKSIVQAQVDLLQRLDELETFDRRNLLLTRRLFDQALECRRRPLADRTDAYQRMTRDLAKTLGKKIKLVIQGDRTQIDRDVLDLLDAPLIHILRNAIDHGIENPAARIARGKPETGVIRLHARHHVGMLWLEIEDDGNGLDPELLRKRIVARGMVNQSTADRLSEAELLEFLLLPGFSTRDEVSEVSGRGVGLDVVHHLVTQIRGSIKIINRPGMGMKFQVLLPLTLSVSRNLIAEVAGEDYAFPLSRVHQAVTVASEHITLIEGRQHFVYEGVEVSLISAQQLLQLDTPPIEGELSVILLSMHSGMAGIVVDRLVGERTLVVQPIDSRLGKLRNISAAAVTQDGIPTLIVDIDDMIRSAELLIEGGNLQRVQRHQVASVLTRKKILVVDDSLTVRELERKLLTNLGYEVTIAVDGVDGWNTLRAGEFDLILTDIDMPRMDGIELVTHIRAEPRFASLPIMVVSYKDRDIDRQRGLAAGADYYLTKASFHDQSMVSAVINLIGEATE